MTRRLSILNTGLGISLLCETSGGWELAVAQVGVVAHLFNLLRSFRQHGLNDGLDGLFKPW